MMTSPQATEVQQFLIAYAKKEKDLQSLRTKRDVTGITGLFSGFAGLYRLHQLHLKTVAREYDLFEILRISHLEEKMHTPVLSHLLSPNASHAQGDLFYRTIIEKILPPSDHELFGKSEFLQVEAEKHTGGLGRIDIFIANPSSVHRFAIVIENKIYASDQPQQMERYYRYAREYLGLPPERIRLIYLTLRQSQPSPFSLCPMLKAALEYSGIYYNITYQDHIQPWLESLLKEVEAPVVRQTIVQYLRTLKSL